MHAAGVVGGWVGLGAWIDWMSRVVEDMFNTFGLLFLSLVATEKGGVEGRKEGGDGRLKDVVGEEEAVRHFSSSVWLDTTLQMHLLQCASDQRVLHAMPSLKSG